MTTPSRRPRRLRAAGGHQIGFPFHPSQEAAHVTGAGGASRELAAQLRCKKKNRKERTDFLQAKDLSFIQEILPSSPVGVPDTLLQSFGPARRAAQMLDQVFESCERVSDVGAGPVEEGARSRSVDNDVSRVEIDVA